VSGPGGPPGYPPYPGSQQPVAQPCCVRHPDRPTGLLCVRCDRPSCPECLREASVGFQCVDCVREGARSVRTPSTIAGAVLHPGAGSSVVVPALIVVNTALFLFTALQGLSLQNNYRSALFQDWVLFPPAVVAGEWWRLVTAGFLHYGPVHLVFNMLALWFIGRDLEQVLGRARFSAVYVVSLLGGSAAAFVFGAVYSQVAGASGAVFGLMGGLAVVLRRLNRPPRPALTLIAVNVAISIVLPGISLLGHLGGLVVGAAATAVLVYAPRADRVRWQVIGIAALVVIVLLAMGARMALLS
jgi:membrane associated rhomboid family serine protease